MRTLREAPHGTVLRYRRDKCRCGECRHAITIQARKYYKPRFPRKNAPNVPEDIWKRVAIGAPDECWPWLGFTDAKGYGRIKVNNANYGTHRLAYELATGRAPGDLFVCHHCDNPPCCNPAHLFLGTTLDNIRDAMSKGRLRNLRGIAHPNAKLNDDSVREIRRLREAGLTTRELGPRFGVTQAAISAVCTRQSWAHIK